MLGDGRGGVSGGRAVGKATQRHSLHVEGISLVRMIMRNEFNRLGWSDEWQGEEIDVSHVRRGSNNLYLLLPGLSLFGGSSERADATRPSQNENKNASSIFQALAALTSPRQLVSDHATPSVLPCITI